MSWLETHRSFVNSWECDENVHMNIQFYWKRFGEASLVFFQKSGLQQRTWIDRHVRYHRELMMGTNTLVRSMVATDAHLLVHELLNFDTGEVAATAIDRFEQTLEVAEPQGLPVPEIARPRGLPETPLDVPDVQPILHSSSGLVTNHSLVTPDQCDHAGQLLDQFAIARFSDAASHLWHHLGASRDWMRQCNLGTVAVEMKTTLHAPVTSGVTLETVSWPSAIGSKTFSFRHQVLDLVSSKPLYSGAVTALLMDLTARRSVTLPDVLKQNARL